MPFKLNLEPFNNVSATGRAVLNSKLVLGNVIESITLELGGTTFTKAMLTSIRVRLNGKVVFGDISGTLLDLIQRRQDGVNDANRLTIDFTEPDAQSLPGQLMGCINTVAAGIHDVTVEVDIAGATAPTLAAYATLRSPSDMDPARGFDPNLAPIIRALIPTTIPVSAAGEIQGDVNYGSRGDSLIKRIFLSSSILTNFRMRRDGLDIYEGGSKARNDYEGARWGRSAQANLWCVEPIAAGNQYDALPTRRADGTASNFQFLLTASGAGSHTVFTDIYTTLDRL